MRKREHSTGSSTKRLPIKAILTFIWIIGMNLFGACNKLSDMHFKNHSQATKKTIPEEIEHKKLDIKETINRSRKKKCECLCECVCHYIQSCSCPCHTQNECRCKKCHTIDLKDPENKKHSTEACQECTSCRCNDKQDQLTLTIDKKDPLPNQMGTSPLFTDQTIFDEKDEESSSSPIRNIFGSDNFSNPKPLFDSPFNTCWDQTFNRTNNGGPGLNLRGSGTRKSFLSNNSFHKPVESCAFKSVGIGAPNPKEDKKISLEMSKTAPDHRRIIAGLNLEFKCLHPTSGKEIWAIGQMGMSDDLKKERAAGPKKFDMGKDYKKAFCPDLNIYCPNYKAITHYVFWKCKAKYEGELENGKEMNYTEIYGNTPITYPESKAKYNYLELTVTPLQSTPQKAG